MKKIILAVALLTGIGSFAQNIATKKDKILFDKKEIAKFEVKKKLYTISDFNGNVIVKIKPTIHDFNEHSRVIYYEVTSADGTRNVSLYNKSDKSPLSFEKKFLYDFTLGEYKLFTPEGIDLNVVETMLNSNLNVKDEIVAKANEIKKEEDRLRALVKDSRIDFNDKGDIIKNRNELIGSFKRKTETNGVGKTYEIYNADNKLIGSWYSLKSNVSFGGENHGTVKNELLLINGKRYEISGANASSGFSLSMDNLAVIIVGYALENGLLNKVQKTN